MLKASFDYRARAQYSGYQTRVCTRVSVYVLCDECMCVCAGECVLPRQTLTSRISRNKPMILTAYFSVLSFPPHFLYI